MTFWHVQVGPHYDGDTRVSGRRCIGELVCPTCDNVLARLHDDAGGVDVVAWVPATGQAPADPGGRRVGWTLRALVDEVMPDSQAAVLRCWRGCDPVSITARDCREVTAAYRATGRKRRRVARPLADEGGR